MKLRVVTELHRGSLESFLGHSVKQTSPLVDRSGDTLPYCLANVQSHLAVHPMPTALEHLRVIDFGSTSLAPC